MEKIDLRTVHGETYRFKAYAANGMVYVEGAGDRQASGHSADRLF